MINVIIPRRQLEYILRRFADMIDNAELDALNEPELVNRLERAQCAYDVGMRYLNPLDQSDHPPSVS